MNSTNKVVLVGHLGADPRCVSTSTGRKVANFSIATNDFIKSGDGEKIKRTDWHKVVVWGKTADACEKLLKKGSMVLVEGKIRNIINEESKVPSYEIYASNVSFISNWGKKEEQQ
jgi:single-strand DNA-binding protein